jgi:ubiquinone/menaquinone biosynthesis C-methylase UbiE
MDDDRSIDGGANADRGTRGIAASRIPHGHDRVEQGLGAVTAWELREGPTTANLNPQAAQMADESMVRNLEAQARAIWPQEKDLFGRYGLYDEAAILDAGCGTGEISSRLAELYPRANVLGVDIQDEHLDRAREHFGALAPRLRFEHQSVFALETASGTFDLTVCRHVIHALPQPERVLDELVRVTRPGGWLHLILEDYGMLHFQCGDVDPRDFWHEAPAAFGKATGTDLFSGRNALTHLRGRYLSDIAIDYVVVDTLRVPREVFATILEAWRDGYAQSISELTRFSLDEVASSFKSMLANVRDPDGYAAWMVPVVSARTAKESRLSDRNRRSK